MTHKKINGYSISLKEVLGRGSYGTVQQKRRRFTRGNRMAPWSPVLWRCSKRRQVLAVWFSWRRGVSQEGCVRVDIDPPDCEIREYCGSVRRHGKCQQLLHHPGTVYRWSAVIHGDQDEEERLHWGSRGNLHPQIDLQRFYDTSQVGDCSSVCFLLWSDLKPANILMVGNKPKIADFGFAKSTSRSKREKILRSSVGTPLYMSLEQLRS